MKKSFEKKILPALFAALIALVFLIAFVVAEGVKPALKGSVKTGGFDGDYYTALCYKLTYGTDEALDSVWINLGSTDYTVAETDDDGAYPAGYGENGLKEQIKIFAGAATSASTDFTKRADKDSGENVAFIVNNDVEGAKPGKWQKLYSQTEPLSSTYEYFILATKNDVRIDGIAFVGVTKTKDGGYLKDYSLMTATGVGYGAKGTSASGSNSWYKNLKANNNTLDMTESGVRTAESVMANAKTFNAAKISGGEYTGEGFNLSEYEVIESARSVTGGGEYLSAKQSPLYLLTVAPFIKLFGAGSLGVRFVSMLCSVGAIMVAYYFALAFIKGDNAAYYALIAAAGAAGVFAALSFTAAFSFAPTLAFGLAATYLYALYYKGGYAKRDGFAFTLGGGALFGLSVALKIKGLTFIVPCALFAILGLINKKKNGAHGDALTLDIVVAVFSLVLVPMIINVIPFMAAFNAYSVGGKNLFGIIVSHFAAAL